MQKKEVSKFILRSLKSEKNNCVRCWYFFLNYKKRQYHMQFFFLEIEILLFRFSIDYTFLFFNNHIKNPKNYEFIKIRIGDF